MDVLIKNKQKAKKGLATNEHFLEEHKIENEIRYLQIKIDVDSLKENKKEVWKRNRLIQNSKKILEACIFGGSERNKIALMAKDKKRIQSTESK